MSSRRLKVEYETIVASNVEFLKQIELCEDNLFKWTALILPSNPPYNKAAFRVQIDFPAAYPFKPPVIRLLTPIYHPNVDKNGIPCLPVITPENWKPSLRIEEVLTALVALINTPELEHALRPDLAEELSNNPKKFNRKAEDWCKNHGEPRSAADSTRKTKKK